MIPSMIASVETMLERWKHYEGKGIDVCGPFRVLRSEVISRTAFGSSYVEGGQIFDLLTELSALISRTTHNIRLPGVRRILRNKDDIEAEKIEQLLHDSIMKIVKKRQDEEKSGQENNFGSDYLGSLLKARDPNKQLSAVEIIDECKTFYFAGQETTCGLLSRGMLLLAIHADWQEKARSELNMIIYETLRLYSPVATLTRRIRSKVMLGKYEFTLAIPTLLLHRNPDIWGEDAHLFKPERFSEGLAKATIGNAEAFLGFGFGPRMCIGMNFAVNEAKIALSMVLQRYKFTLSPN